MAAKMASLSTIFTREEIAKMDPNIKSRIEIGINQAIVKAGGKVADPILAKAQFDALRTELVKGTAPALKVAKIR